MADRELICEICDRLNRHMIAHEVKTKSAIEQKYGVNDAVDNAEDYWRYYETIRCEYPFVQVKRTADGAIGWLIRRSLPFIAWGFVPESEL